MENDKRNEKLRHLKEQALKDLETIKYLKQ